MLRVAGGVALFVLAFCLASCTQTSVDAGASPSPVIPAGNWTQQLTFAGDVTGRL